MKDKSKYPGLNEEFAPVAALFLGLRGSANADLNRGISFSVFRSKLKEKAKYPVLNREFAPAAALFLGPRFYHYHYLRELAPANPGRSFT